MRRNLILSLAVCASLSVVLATIAPATSHDQPICLQRPEESTSGGDRCAPRLEFRATVGLTPRGLPRRKMRPIGLGIRGKIRYADGSQPPALEEVTAYFDRNTGVDATGLQDCPRSALEHPVSVARRACPGSIVGTGFARVVVPSAGQEPISIPLTLINGGSRDRVTTLFVQSYLPAPAGPLIATVRFYPIDSGRFGLRATAEIPKIANGTGSILDFRLTIERRIEHAGEDHAYALARCFDRRLIASFKSTFRDGTQLAASAVQSCFVRD